MSAPLDGLRVVEFGAEIAGPYCAKLLADLGATVAKVEEPQGDPLRAWGPFPGGVADPARSGLFEYLNAGKRGVCVDVERSEDLAVIRELVAEADILVENLGPGVLDGWDASLARDALQELNPDLVVVRISDFGQDGPLRDRAATPLTMQAAGGWVNVREPDRPPVQGGARIPEYIAGAYAALAGLTALRVAAAGVGRPVEVDVSALECLLSTLPYPMLMAERLKALGLPVNVKAAPMLGVVRAADGWVGINCLTGQHWLDVCAMVGLPEFGEHQLAIMLGGPERDDFFGKAQPWLDEHAVADIVELSQLLRIPAAPVTDGGTILDCPQYAQREFFIEGGGDDWRFTRPDTPFRMSKSPRPAAGSAPARAGRTDPPGGNTRFVASSESPGDPDLPFAGLRIFDLSTFWAGAYLTCYLGAFGADVIKVESIQRPDSHRFSGALLRTGDDWYERGAMWQGTNHNKRDLTLDLGSAEGRAVARRLAATADVVVENFSPRVVEQFGLDYDTLAELNPGVIMVRMPGFGLEGPWRDYVGWALNIEQLSGMSAVTGYPDGPPCNLQGPADPIAGVHAAAALLAALEQRNRTGEGQLIELAQIEVGAAVTAEPVIEYSLNGTTMPREGNRHRLFLQGVYPTAADDDWVALSVRDDADWHALVTALGRSELRDDPKWAKAEARRTHHDEADRLIGEWTGARQPDEIVDSLTGLGVPVARVLTPDRMYDSAQLAQRGYYAELEHPSTGADRFPGWPFRITPGPRQHHRTVAPRLGQHNAEVLTELGLSTAEIEDLRLKQVIGERLLET